MDRKIGLYTHWPFCKARCRYCGFFTLAGKDKLLPSYAEAVEMELKGYQEQLRNYQVESIYLGGGTPSLAEAKLIVDLLTECKQRLKLAGDMEITIEANPESLTPEKLTSYLDVGINRLSIGLQAWQDEWLMRMGRLYKHGEFVEKYKLARKCGFTNIGVDLIFGMPGQTVEEWRESVQRLMELIPEHISCYSLELDKNSFWGRDHRQGKLVAADEQVDRKMYHLAQRLLKQAGYGQYEVSNWSKPGYECKHNLMFWKGREYLGIGAGAYSHFEGKYWQNVEDIKGYIDKITQGERTRAKVIREEGGERLAEFILLRLRLTDGLDLLEFEKRFGVKFKEKYQDKVKQLRELGLVKLHKNRLKLTQKGLDVVDQVTLELVAND